MNEVLTGSELPQGSEQVEVELTSTGAPTGVERETEDDSVSEAIKHPFDPTDIDIATKSRTIHLLMEQIKHGELNLTPDFQRKAGIWSPKQMSRLIESILLRIPLPMFYISEDKDESWLVVDGLQRLSTLDKFVVREKSFVLRGLEFLSTFEGMKFQDLPRKMQRRLLETEVILHVVQPGTPKAVVRTIFQRINTGGLPLSAQEIRHALYQGRATRLLRDLAESSEFYAATLGSIKDDRMADRECVLRAIAFMENGVDAYIKKDQDGFLSETMEGLNTCTESEIEKISERVKKSLLDAHLIFGADAFRKQYANSATRYPINKALFETWCAVLADQSPRTISALIEKRDEVKELFISLLSGQLILADEDNEYRLAPRRFHDSISQDTSEVRKVRTRFGTIKYIIETVAGK